MCLSLSTLSLLRYSSVKSSLNLPWKFLIRLVSSTRPKEAIEVISLSVYVVAIVPTFEKDALED